MSKLCFTFKTQIYLIDGEGWKRNNKYSKLDEESVIDKFV